MPDLNGPTETSPLLENSDSTTANPTGAITGVSPNGVLNGPDESTQDPEQQDDPVKQQGGMQDVKLLQFFPALAIGVTSFAQPSLALLIPQSGISCCCRPDHHRINIC